ncbi:hypothetical protein D2962_06035 [Biomaibacter acetigenes]|uniref:Uncharacterized protein n=1 Tax=Biomaibacter acetigenes TaxID=2316383 RepID=A0A3G2R464_9FIRM|nr:hypothetical protein [Biomaibacter acetigenes]AYO30236.1 hypothetical protein D2962_06035 [Biomaibacter acetigenes]
MYTSRKFEMLCREFLNQEEKLMCWKAGEYTNNDDRLKNFNMVAGFLGVSPADVALTYLLKHIQSVTLAVKSKNYKWEWETENGEGLKQRIADARNYLLLLAACIDEEVVKTNGSQHIDK